MPEPVRKPNKPLYDRDFCAWTEEQGSFLRARNAAGLDWENLAEEVESLGRREKNEITSRLRVLLGHLLKWQFQPERRNSSWQTTISEQRAHLLETLEASHTLQSFLAEVFPKSYARARRDAARETRLASPAFPADPPFSINQALDDDFMPGQPWSPEELE